MSAYPLEKVIRLWAAGKITKKQAIGQILQLMQGLQKRLGELERRESERRRRERGVS
jgi:hypothetical protein